MIVFHMDTGMRVNLFIWQVPGKGAAAVWSPDIHISILSAKFSCSLLHDNGFQANEKTLILESAAQGIMPEIGGAPLVFPVAYVLLQPVFILYSTCAGDMLDLSAA